MYRYSNKKIPSTLTSVEKLEGEPIEWKIERIVNNGEPITDGAPEIFTERKDGVLSAYNIRTDRWEIATDAMDKVSGSIQARRDARGQKKSGDSDKEGKIVEMKADVGNESITATGGK